MTQIDFTPGDARWSALRDRALNDLYWFAEVVMGYGDKIPMRPLAHKALTKFMAQDTGVEPLDDATVQLILQPRELGKSTIARCWVIQRLCKYPNRSILLCSETATLATAILASIKQEMLTNELLRSLFHDVIPKDDKQTMWKADQINVLRTTTRPEPSLMIAGADKAITGFHPDDILVDDLVGREMAENARIGDRSLTESAKGWIRTLIPIVNKQAQPRWRLKFVGTPWFMGDPYEYIEELFGNHEEPQTFTIKQRIPDNNSLHTITVTRRGEMAMMRRSAIEHGRSIFPEKWDLEELAKRRIADPQGFACWLMCLPTDQVTQIFKDDWFAQHWHAVDHNSLRVVAPDGRQKTYRWGDLDCVLACDPGGFRREMRGAGRARPAIILTGTTPDDQHCILEAWSEPETYQECAQQIIEFCLHYPVRKVVIERAGQQVMFIDLVQQLARKARVQVAFEEYQPDARDKAQRILVLEPYAQHGQLLLGSGPKFHELRTQLAQFPNGSRLDLVDALHMLTRFWRRSSGMGSAGVNKSVQERRQRELADYYRKRGLTT